MYEDPKMLREELREVIRHRNDLLDVVNSLYRHIRDLEHQLGRSQGCRCRKGRCDEGWTHVCLVEAS